jgi:transcriptional regulator EpsA
MDRSAYVWRALRSHIRATVMINLSFQEVPCPMRADERLMMQCEPAVLVLPDAVMDGPEGVGSIRTDELQAESLMLNLDASLRVYARHEFFSWTQGALQSLIEHELLICAMPNGEPGSFYVDSFSTALVEPARLSELFRQDVTLVPQLIKAWEANHCEPIVFDAAGGGAVAGSALGREMARIGASTIVVHGTYDACGELASFFTFGCTSGTARNQQRHIVGLVVPFLHAAWMRTRINWPAEGAGVKPAVESVLTARETEILQWIYHGKSNIEIGMILGISALTVKNHVQKILRKLDVLNRTQAIGKALALRILNP